MKKFLITIVAVFLIVTGTNASGSLNASKSTRSFYADFVMRSCMKKLQKAFTTYYFSSHYDAATGQNWTLVGTGGPSSGIITTAFYMSGSTQVFASWVESSTPYNGPYTNEWYWVDTDTVHVVCKVHWNLADDGYFIVGEDIVLSV